MKISLSISPDNPRSAPIIFKNGLEHGITQAATLGYDAVELHIHDLWTIDADALRAQLETYHLPVSSIGPGLVYGGDAFSFVDADAGVRQQALERIQLLIDLCQKLGTLAMVGVVHGNVSHDAATRRTQMERIVEYMRAIDAYAGARGVKLALEAINRYETNCFNRAEEMVALIEENNLRSSGILLDNFHMNIEEVSIEDAIRTAGKHLALVHFSDSNRWYPGAGHLDLAAIVRVLREIGYAGYLSLETLPLPDPDTAARKGLANTRRLVVMETKGVVP
jgi:sugar phosphate isomerase/epimerase